MKKREAPKRELPSGEWSPWIWWRVHPKGEAPETVLDPYRADGWAPGNETAETQPLGISVMESLDALRDYIRYSSLKVRPGDKVLEVKGRVLGPGRDEGEVKLIVTKIVRVHPASILGPA